MKTVLTFYAALIVGCFAHQVRAQELQSVRLSDVIKSQGTGNIDLLRDVTAEQLENYRVDNGGYLVFGVDINEDASGTEKASSQGIAVKSIRFTASFSDGSELVLNLDQYCCFSETQALLAEAPGVERQTFYTLLGESGSSRITHTHTHTSISRLLIFILTKVRIIQVTTGRLIKTLQVYGACYLCF